MKLRVTSLSVFFSDLLIKVRAIEMLETVWTISISSMSPFWAIFISLGTILYRASVNTLPTTKSCQSLSLMLAPILSYS